MKRRGIGQVSIVIVYLSCSHISFRFSDDEDTSYNIRRRPATKLLAVAMISTHPDRPTCSYKDVSPIAISHFGDREETV